MRTLCVYSTMKNIAKVRLRSSEKLILAVAALIALALAEVASRRGMPQRWDVAIAGTVVPFGVALMNFRRLWSRISFWISFLICLAAHTFVIWVVFQRLLASIQRMGIIFWVPIMFIELFVLIVVIARIYRMLSGDHGQIKLS